MALIDIAINDPSALWEMNIEQIVAICGDGKLKDKSPCSQQFRQILTRQSSEYLAEFARYCLDNKFDRSGFILQDVVNEIGRRLGYSVTNGRYSGVRNEIGFDGTWADTKNTLVVEVKTTDAYRINLDSICEYGTKLENHGAGPSESLYTLIIVGRQDTGDLEAQIRGSRHAWNVRLISVDALIKLMFVNEEFDDVALTEKVRRVLLPFEYTRVDHIIDLVFETQQETETKTQAATEVEEELVATTGGGWTPENTPKVELEDKRNASVTAFSILQNSDLVKVSKTNFSDDQSGLHVTCAVSKKYKRDYQTYWYALHPNWVEFMKQAPKAFFVLACMDRTEAYAIPLSNVLSHLEGLNKTESRGRSYWHISLGMDGERLFWVIPKTGEKIDLANFEFSIA